LSAVLVIGYGNPLRGDDGIGYYVAQALDERFRAEPDVEVIAAQELTPEMAEDVARSEMVLFVDAAAAGEPGTIRHALLVPDTGPGGFTHLLTPSTLLSAAGELYGDAPSAITLTLAGWSFALGERLSRPAKQRMPEMLRQAVALVQEHRKNASSENGSRTR
jgi:hydrogenase maturation protease